MNPATLALLFLAGKKSLAVPNPEQPVLSLGFCGCLFVYWWEKRSKNESHVYQPGRLKQTDYVAESGLELLTLTGMHHQA